ncbi:hypothetical protein BJX63DRAFT_37518 [Aspergillus granulosus]|uniref:Uncharacterized protein n=1 Tax=Aspergillus granulosus TaxID=176169 RepID=A0ABR4H0R7_9EURO
MGSRSHARRRPLHWQISLDPKRHSKMRKVVVSVLPRVQVTMAAALPALTLTGKGEGEKRIHDLPEVEDSAMVGPTSPRIPQEIPSLRRRDKEGMEKANNNNNYYFGIFSFSHPSRAFHLSYGVCR